GIPAEGERAERGGVAAPRVRPERREAQRLEAPPRPALAVRAQLDRERDPRAAQAVAQRLAHEAGLGPGQLLAAAVLRGDERAERELGAVHARQRQVALEQLFAERRREQRAQQVRFEHVEHGGPRAAAARVAIPVVEQLDHLALLAAGRLETRGLREYEAEQRLGGSRAPIREHGAERRGPERSGGARLRQQRLDAARPVAGLPEELDA